MTNRTRLKENRNNWLWYVWFMLLCTFAIVFPEFYLREDKSVDFEQKMFLSAVFFCLISVVYRVLTFCFNFILAKIVKKRFKINRLKGRVNPIYKLGEDIYEEYFVTKYVAQYTNLDLEWSVPFSVLFLEQEYVRDSSVFTVKKVKELADLKEFWEAKKAEKVLEQSKEISAKILKEQKIENLNKVFSENYK